MRQHLSFSGKSAEAQGLSQSGNPVFYSVQPLPLSSALHRVVGVILLRHKSAHDTPTASGEVPMH